MKPETKYNLLLSLAMVVGLGGFMFIIAVIWPLMKKGDLLGPAVILGWALIIILLLFLRYRVAKKDEKIQAQIKKEAEKFSKVVEKKMERRAKLKKRISKPFTDSSELKDDDDEPDDSDDDEGDTPELPENKE